MGRLIIGGVAVNTAGAAYPLGLLPVCLIEIYGLGSVCLRIESLECRVDSLRVRQQLLLLV